LDAKIDSVLEQKGPFICEIMMSDIQPLIPRVSSIKKPDGSIVSQPLENLFPFLNKKEYDCQALGRLESIIHFSLI
jgi:acetolactate synthase I/II/III large subunit